MWMIRETIDFGREIVQDLCEYSKQDWIFAGKLTIGLLVMMAAIGWVEGV
jgi:hypothetical protein